MTINIKGYDVQIDDEDWDRVSQYRWRTSKKKNTDTVYIRAHQYINDKRVDITLHRFIMGCRYGDGTMVDHINHDTLDNRKNNLRFCTGQENNQNRRKPVVNTTGYKGIRVSTGNNRWGAVVSLNRKNTRVGTYSTPEEAARMYDMLAIKLQGEFACTNFPKTHYSIQDIENAYTEALRVCSCNNKSGYRGVSKHKKNGTYVSAICINRKTIYLGSFITDIEAAKAYDKKALELLGDKANLNFPENKGATR